MTTTTKATTGRWLLMTVLLATVLGEIAFTWLGWTGQHVFNPEWHPHARFHVVQESVLISALCVAGMWLLWRRRLDRRLVATMVVFVQVVYQGGEYVAMLVPGTSPPPDLSRPNDVDLLGLAVPGNLLFSTMLIVLSVVGGLLILRSGDRGRPATTAGSGEPGGTDPVGDAGAGALTPVARGGRSSPRSGTGPPRRARRRGPRAASS